MRTTSIFLLMAAALVTGGCDHTEGDWTAAKQANTVAAYQQFLAAHPQGAHAGEARDGIDSLDWKEAQTRGTTDGYQKYLSAHAGGAHAGAAKDAIESAAWDQTRTEGAGRFSAYVDFHRKYPGSTRLTALTADVVCSQNISISFGSAFSGSMSLSSLNVRVSGHPELSGEYQPDEPGARSLIQRYEQLGGTVGKLPHARLLAAEIKGKRRIVALEVD